LEELETYKEIGQEYIDKLKLTTYPVAVRLVPPDEEVSSNALRSNDVFGSQIAACIAYTWCRRSGFSFFLTGEDIGCKPASIRYFGLERTKNADDVYTAWGKKGGYKKDKESEIKSRENELTLDYGEIKGLIITPLNLTIVKPHLVMIYCTPLILHQLILAATYEGDYITSYFNGMESSCKEGIIRTYKTDQCQVVSPGGGDRGLGGVQDNEMIFSIPESKFEMVLNNLLKAGSKLSVPKAMGIPLLNASLGPISFFGSPAEPGPWDYLRKIIKKNNA
jgi:uncharacterized protein (DUF169 family)